MKRLIKAVCLSLCILFFLTSCALYENKNASSEPVSTEDAVSGTDNKVVTTSSCGFSENVKSDGLNAISSNNMEGSEMILSDDFESGALDESIWTASSGVGITNSGTIDGKGSLIMNGSSYIQTKDFDASDDLITMEISIKVVSIENPLPDDNNFNSINTGELFHITFDEKDKIPSNNYWSSKFRLMADNTYSKISFTGYDTDATTLSDTAKSPDGSYFVPADATYKVKIAATKTRVYIYINDGQMVTSFSSARSVIKNIRLTNREGVVTLIDNVKVATGKEPAFPLSENTIRYFNMGLFKGYINSQFSSDGLVLFRHTADQMVLYSSFTKAFSYQTGMTIDTYTNSRSVKLAYKVLDSDYASGWTTAFDVCVNGVKQDLSDFTTVKGQNYIFYFKLRDDAPENNRITIYFPAGVSVAVTDLAFDEGSVQYPVEDGKKLLLYGDSITQGAECFFPTAVFGTQVAMKYNLAQINQSVGGTTFDKVKIAAGNYNGFAPDYIIIAYGTNTFAGGNQPQSVLDNLDTEVRANIDAIKEKFPQAKIIALTPLYRNDENNGNTFKLIDVINKLKTIYASYPDISVIDTHDFVPPDPMFFSNSTLMLHPNTFGHMEFSKNLLQKLIPIMGEPPAIDWQAKAGYVIKSGGKT